MSGYGTGRWIPRSYHDDLTMREFAKPFKVPEDATGDPGLRAADDYGVSIINRGEQLRYTDRNGFVIVEICIPGRWIDGQSIEKWDSGLDVTDAQKDAVIARVQRYFEEYQGFPVKIIAGDQR